MTQTNLQINLDDFIDPINSPLELTVIDLIKEQVIKNPSNPAVKFGEKFITYQELEEKSDELALKLRQQGVFNGDKIVVMLPVSFELIIAAYGIFKAGGGYVPVNPKDGNELIQFILEDLHSRIVIGNSKTLDKIKDITFAALLELNTLKDNWITDFRKDKEIDLNEEEKLLPEVKPNNLAFIIYTSGTTGKPKGVILEHSNLQVFIESMRKVIDINPGDKWLQNPNVHFDLAVGTMFLSLCNGSTLVLEEGDLAEVMIKEEITHYLGTPSTATMVDPKVVPHLKVLAVAGEKCPDELIARFAPYGNLFIGYGPAETTIICTLNQSNQWKKQNIGSMLEGVEYYVVTPQNKLAKMGEPGELWIAGDFVAKGYLNRPELTDEKFIDNPFGRGRLYKSGDRVRWLRPGFMEFLGRVDRQVKIRGHRVELDGLEQIINGFDRVSGTHSKIINDNLVAYVTPETIDLSKLFNYLRKQLPPYAIPGKIIPLKSFPLTRSGKINTRGLPDPFDVVTAGGDLPTTQNELELERIWKTVLFPGKVSKKIYLGNNFFDLGGTSLHALKIIGKLRRNYSNHKIPLELIYKNPTFEDFSKAIETFLSKKNQPTLKMEKIQILDIFKCLPSTLFFMFGYLFPAIVFVAFLFKFPVLIFYYFFELILFKLFGGKIPPILQKIRNKINLDRFSFNEVKITETTEIKNQSGNIFCIHPHGLMDLHIQSLERYYFNKGFQIRNTFHSTLFSLPLLRSFLFLLGYLPAVKKTYKYLDSEKINIFSTMGDISEYLLCHKPSTVSLSTNELFLKIAIENGYSLIPVYAFDTEKSFKFYPNLHNLRDKLKIGEKALAIVPFSGRFFLPLPFKINCKIAVGPPIKFEKKENPTWKDIQDASLLYASALLKLYNDHKSKENPDLSII